MAIFKERLPQRDVLLAVLIACLIPVHFWSVFNVLRELPAWIIRMSVWDTAGVIAYTQSFALFETLVLVLLFVTAAFILPGRLLRDHLAVSSALLMLILTIWLVVLHYNSHWLAERNMRVLALWSATFLIASGTLLWLSRKSEALQVSSGKIISRLSVLAALFLIIDVASVGIILIRNLSF